MNVQEIFFLTDFISNSFCRSLSKLIIQFYCLIHERLIMILNRDFINSMYRDPSQL